MVAALFAAVLAALPASGQGTWLELDANAALDVRTLTSTMPQPPMPPTGGWLGGSGTVGVTVYGRRVVDDDAAPPLQPFLQRVARFRLEGGGGSASIEYPFFSLSPAAPSSYLRAYPASDRGGRVEAQADGYLGRWLYGAVRVGIDYERWMPSFYDIGGFGNVTPMAGGAFSQFDSSELRLNSSAAIGLRRRDLLLTAGWSVSAFRIADDALQVRFWGGAFVAGRAVVRRFVELAARVDVLDGGATVQGSATVWLRRRFGLSAGLEGAHGAFADSPVVYDRAGGRVGVAWWYSTRGELSFAYAPAWQRGTAVAGLGIAERDFSFVAHVFTLTVTSRPPLSRVTGP